MALANFTLANAATPNLPPVSPAPVHVQLDDLLYSPEQQQEFAQLSGNEPFQSPNQPQRRSKLRKRAGAAYLPPPNQYTHYPRHDDVPHNPYNGPLHTQIYQQQHPRLDVQIENQRVQEVNQQYDNTGQYVHDPTGDYDYEQRRTEQTGRRPPYNPGFADPPYGPVTTPPTSSRRFDSNLNHNVNNFNFGPSTTPAPSPSRPHSEAGSKTAAASGGSNQQLPDRPRGFTKVETASSGGKTQLHAVLDYDDDYYDDVPGPGNYSVYYFKVGPCKVTVKSYYYPINILN